MKTKTSVIRTSINRSPLRYGLFLTALALACFALSPAARATCREGCLADGNTVLGDDALLNSTGGGNTATGFSALNRNTTGIYNTATGDTALFRNMNGSYNTATGVNALFNNISGSYNTATGLGALGSNTDGISNTATGWAALISNTHGVL